MEIKQGSNIKVNINWDSFGISSVENISFLSVMFETYDKFPCCNNTTDCRNINCCSCNNYQNYNQLPYNVSKCNCVNLSAILLDNYRYCDNRAIDDDDVLPTFSFPKEVLSYCGEYRIILTVVYKKGTVYKLTIDFGIQFVLTRNNNMENSDVTISLEGSNATTVTNYVKGLAMSNSENSVIITADTTDSASKLVSIPNVSSDKAGIVVAKDWVRIKNVLDNWRQIPSTLNIVTYKNDPILTIALATEEEDISDTIEFPVATADHNGVMSAEDKTRLDSLYNNADSNKGKIINNTLIL